MNANSITISDIASVIVEQFVKLLKQVPYVGVYAAVFALMLIVGSNLFPRGAGLVGLVILALIAGIAIRATQVGIARVVADE